MRVSAQVSRPCVFVSDFDGTMTRSDFYRLAIERLLPDGAEQYWQEYRSGLKTHFQALQSIYSRIRADEATVVAMLAEMQMEPRLPELLPRLAEAGWDVVVVSAGCGWYIEKLFAQLGVSLPLHTNPGTFVPGSGLLMTEPFDSPYYHPETGIDKAAVVRDLLAVGKTVAFAGDGFPDAPAARLVPADLRFAKDDLVEALTQSGDAWRPFREWSEAAEALLEHRS